MIKRTMEKRSPLHVVLDIVIGIMSVLAVGAVIFTINMFAEEWSYSYDAESFYYRLESEDYRDMVEMYYMYETAGVKPDEELQQYYGVAKYFEAASYYKVYHDAEDEEQMAKYLNRMEMAREQMGVLSIAAEDIDDKLGL